MNRFAFSSDMKPRLEIDYDADDVKRSKDDFDHEKIDDMKEVHESDDADDLEMGDDYCDCASESDCDGDSVSDTNIRGDDNGDIVFDLRKMQRALAKFICSDEVHPLIVFDMHFKNIVSALCPLFKTDYDSVKVDCLQIYEEEKGKVKHFLRNRDGNVSLSVDVLRYQRSNGIGYDFMSLAAHFIDNNWKLKTWILSFRRIGDWNCDCLDQAILNCLKDWEIEDKISTLTFLNNYMCDEIVEMIKAQVQEKKKIQLDGQLFSVSCCAEMFCLMVEDALKEISNIINKIKEIMCWGKSLPVWYITHHTLKEALQLDSIGEFSSQNVRDNSDVPTTDEWKKVESVCKLLDNTYYVAKVLFETKYPTASTYLHNLQELQVILTRESTSSDRFTSDVAKKMLQRLNNYLKDMFLVLAIASVMDPRSKMQYIQYSSSKIGETDGNSKVTLVLDTIRSLYDDYVNRDIERENSESDSASSDSEEKGPRSVQDEFCSSNLLKEYNQFIQANMQPPKSDLDLYLEEPVLPWREDFNALRWWKVACPKYPILSKMARDILAIPLSVATSYEAYYTEQRQADTRVVSAGPDLMNALMCTRTWLQGRDRVLSASF